jgi:hypothetical protein
MTATRQESFRRASRKACKCGRYLCTQYTYLYPVSRWQQANEKLAAAKQVYCPHCDGVPTPPTLEPEEKS